MDIDSITSIKSLKINRRIVNPPLFNPVFFFFFFFFSMLLAEKSTEIFPKHKEYFFISESFALN